MADQGQVHLFGNECLTITGTEALRCQEDDAGHPGFGAINTCSRVLARRWS